MKTYSIEKFHTESIKQYCCVEWRLHDEQWVAESIVFRADSEAEARQKAASIRMSLDQYKPYGLDVSSLLSLKNQASAAAVG